MGTMTTSAKPQESKPMIIQDADVWLLRITNPNGRIQEFRCATESQALSLAAVLTQKEALPV